MYGEGCYAETAYTESPIRPATTWGKLTEQMDQLIEVMVRVGRHQLPPSELLRWRAGAIAIKERGLKRSGRTPRGDIAVKYISEKMALKRKLNDQLIGEAADHAGCTTETVRDWLKKEGITK